MARPDSARDRILDAFEEVLVASGERAATLDAVAAAAGVSKGGLLYHFASKEALVDGLIERLDAFVEADDERMRTAEEGAVDYIIRTSVESGSPFDRALIAMSRLAQGSHEKARTALASFRARWETAIAAAVGDPAVARAVMLVSDGLYYNSTMLGAFETRDTREGAMDELIAVLGRLTPADDRSS
ncbi:TetR/AcrR family transcriptional regulator [Labedella endophytica]|uniref:TetR/AcrR family transcriptional regulator n=1 Tax=Labedella endophytica TaxID=1523160 RepID=A0A433JP78_9MICO|nr:TetR/AcrR family transcriptional regulator [Labedella endophytica]RUQ97627.1 TetR/AcrR family transcriptional regulator [Labedella endophytica]